MKAFLNGRPLISVPALIFEEFDSFLRHFGDWLSVSDSVEPFQIDGIIHAHEQSFFQRFAEN